MPANAGGFGNIAQAADDFFNSGIEPMQSVFVEISDQLGSDVIQFRDRVKEE